MVFNANDIYVLGGKDKIYHNWTAGVRKFDTNSFYNWEQDNVPLYDLEDRTYHLWEKNGWDTSTVEGVIFTVSADASSHVVNEITGETIMDADPNIFLDVSSALAAIPNTLRFPLRIEICNFRSVGSLDLHDIKCVGDGALEIVNRPFAKINMHSNVVSGITEGSSVFVNLIASDDLPTMLSPGVGGISAVDLSTTIVSSTTDDRFDGYSQIFIQHPSEIAAGSNLRRTSEMTALFNVGKSGATKDKFYGTIYGHIQDTTATDYDMSSITHPGDTGNQLARAGFWDNDSTEAAGQRGGVGFFYANYFDSLSVKNCTGPIYIRNIQVNGTDMSVTGASLTSYTKDVGIDVLNSQVVLENCLAWRCNKAGIRIINSDVVMSRGSVAYRNYYRANRGSTAVSGGLAYGLQMENSNVSLSGDPNGTEASGGNLILSYNTNQNGVYCGNSTLKGGGIHINNPSATPSLQSFVNDKTGFILENSKILMDGRVEMWQNTNGMKATNSNLECNELRVEYNQEIGMKLDNSKCLYGSSRILRTVPPTLNKNYLTSGLETLIATTNTGYGQTYDYPGQAHFAWNAQHLLMNQSKFTYPEQPWSVADNAWSLGRSKFKMPFGTLTFTGEATFRSTIPGIVLGNNSYGRFFQTAVYTEGNDTVYGDVGTFESVNSTIDGTVGTANPIYGSCIFVDNNSTAIFDGTGDAVTNLQGPVALDAQVYNSLAYACNGSNLKFSGPTLIMRGGVDALAEDNSTVTFAPHWYKQTKFIDETGFALSNTGNHTKVDLHATRACLVAHRNSDLVMKDLGSYADTWTNPSYQGGTAVTTGSSIVASADYGAQDSSAITLGGHLQFYPNAGMALASYPEAILSVNPSGTPKHSIADNISLPLHNTPGLPVGYAASSFVGMYNVTIGGVCLRAMDGSRVEAKNINFPTGWANCSSIFYNYTTTDTKGCQQLKIWNIDGTSKLNASYLSVSGVFPTDAGYTGPSAVYVSGALSGTASGAPSSTPHTNDISVLDSFGTSGPIDSDPRVAPQNFGPFRIYFSPLGPAKWLVYNQIDMSGVFWGPAGTHGTSDQASATGQVYQTLAQGYNPSGTCSALPYSQQGLYDIYTSGPTAPWYVWGALSPSALAGSSMPNGEDWYYTTNADPATGGDPRAPAFFYVKDMLARDYYGRIRFDESAMNTFANAKNASLGTSGRIRLISFYSSTTQEIGESQDSDTDMFGKGFDSASIFDLGRQN